MPALPAFFTVASSLIECQNMTLAGISVQYLWIKMESQRDSGLQSRVAPFFPMPLWGTPIIFRERLSVDCANARRYNRLHLKRGTIDRLLVLLPMLSDEEEHWGNVRWAYQSEWPRVHFTIMTTGLQKNA
jgi:hypothetical protein